MPKIGYIPKDNKMIKYNFTKSKIEKGRKKNAEGCFVSITKHGLVIMSSNLADKLLNGMIGKSIIISLWEDIEHRAFAFKIVNEWNRAELPENYRFIVPLQIGNSFSYRFSNGSFLRKIDKLKLPLNRIQIKEHNDKDQYTQLGHLYVIEIPKYYSP